MNNRKDSTMPMSTSDTTLVADMQQGLDHVRTALAGARVHDPDAIQYWTDQVAIWERAVSLAREDRSLDNVYIESGLSE
jgi:lipopolysaccharide biosynthesis protein